MDIRYAVAMVAEVQSEAKSMARVKYLNADTLKATRHDPALFVRRDLAD